MELSSRSCGSCTKCCEGYHAGGAYGVKFGNGVPCYFLEIGLGCTIYEDRPHHPCQTYKCHWLTNIEVPEHFKPEISHIMPTRRGQKFIVLTNCGPNPNSEVIDWYKGYCDQSGFSMAYRQDNRDLFYGDPEFCAKMYAALRSS